MASNHGNIQIENSDPQQSKIKLTKSAKTNSQNLFEDGYDENFIGDDNDRIYLDSLNQYQREKIIAKRHKDRELLIRKKNILNLVTNDESVMEKKLLTNTILGEKTSRLGMLTQMEVIPHDKSDESIEEDNDYRSESEESDDYDNQDSDDDFNLSSNEVQKKSKKTKRITKLKHRRADSRQNKLKKRFQTKENTVNRVQESNKTESLEILPAKHFELLNKICVKREFLGKLSTRPYFDKTIKHCLVKVNFSTVRGNQYRIGIIRNVLVLPDEEYELNGRTHSKYLEVYFSSGESKNMVAMANVSNRPIDESEAFQLLIKLKDFPERELDLKWIESKKKNIMEMLDFRMTAAEIDNLIQERLKDDSSVSLFEKRQLLEQRYNKLAFQNLNYFSSIRLEKIKEFKRQIESIKEQEKELNKETNQDGIILNKFLQYGQLNETQRKKFKRNVSQPVNLWAIKEGDIGVHSIAQKAKKETKINPELQKKKHQKNLVEIYRNYQNTLNDFQQQFEDVGHFKKVIKDWSFVDYTI